MLKGRWLCRRYQVPLLSVWLCYAHRNRLVVFFLIYIYGCLGLCCCLSFLQLWRAGLLSSCCCGCLFAEGSLVKVPGLQGPGSIVVAFRQLPCGTWDLPGPGIKLVSPVPQGRFSAPGPAGKPHSVFLWLMEYLCVQHLYLRRIWFTW